MAAFWITVMSALTFPATIFTPADQASTRPHNTRLFNLCLIQKMGTDEWARDKALTVKQTYFNGVLRVHVADKKKYQEIVLLEGTEENIRRHT
jgi:hypothetical protein